MMLRRQLTRTLCAALVLAIVLLAVLLTTAARLGWFSEGGIFSPDQPGYVPQQPHNPKIELTWEETAPPTEPLTEPETETETESESETDAPIVPPTEPPTAVPTDTPTEAPTDIPTETPTEADTAPWLNGSLDQTPPFEGTIFSVISEKEERLYLRQGSLGNFNGREWERATPYGEYLYDTFSADYLPYFMALLREPSDMLIVDPKTPIRLLPYYLRHGDDAELQWNDTYAHGPTDALYVLYYTSADRLTALEGDRDPTLLAFEEAYRAFVYENYCEVEARTGMYLHTIIQEQGFDASDPDIIQKVATYVQNAATYNLDYDPGLDEADSTVIAFLDTYREGVCRHYASAATLIYRMLGIPARYTVGFLVDTEAGQWVEVDHTRAHAWVEVYTDGIGWQYVEVTPGNSDGGELPPDETEPDETEPDETEPDETEPDETEPGETEPDETEPDETEPGETDPDETEPGETEPGETEPDETEPDETEPDETEPDETEPIETEPEETLPDQEGAITPEAPPTLNGSLGEAEGAFEGPVFKVYGELAGPMYLKEGTFGDFNGREWLPATAYAELIGGLYGADYLPGLIALFGQETHALQIDPILPIRVNPYYLKHGAGAVIQTSDIFATGHISESYAVYFSPLAATPSGEQDPQAVAYEEAYRAYVYAAYCTVDPETAAYLRTIIDREGFDANDPDIIQKVAAYVQNAAVYDLEYDQALDAEPNIAIAFLETYKSGVCRHYATVATLLYRALGIPARYAVGYLAELEPGVWVEVTAERAHAWAEVYIDGIGWQYVEVTGSSETLPRLTVVLESQAVCYDGESHSYSLTPTLEGFEEYQALGYTYELTLSGLEPHVEPGKWPVQCTFAVIYDSDGNNVTHQFKIATMKAYFQIYLATSEPGGDDSDEDSLPTLTVILASQADRYDGRIHTYNQAPALKGFENYQARGYTYELTLSDSEPRIDPGKWYITCTSVVIYDPDGKDVTHEFTIKKSMPAYLQIYLADIVLVSGDLHFAYTGLPQVGAADDYAIDWEASAGKNGMTVSELRMLLDDYGITLSVEGVSRTNVGTTLTDMNLVATDAQGQKCHDWFKTTKVRGNFTIDRVPLVIVANSATMTFDFGNPYQALQDHGWQYGESTSAKGHDTVMVEITGSQTMPGHSTNLIQSVVVMDGNGRDVTANYQIQYVHGTLTVVMP